MCVLALVGMQQITAKSNRWQHMAKDGDRRQQKAKNRNRLLSQTTKDCKR
jgi:hypothetical protein